MNKGYKKIGTFALFSETKLKSKLILFLSFIAIMEINAAANIDSLNDAELVERTNEEQITITGNVTDSAGVPLPGATVLVKGTNNGTQTDFDGNYTIQADQNDVLVFSYIGYMSQEAPIGGRSIIDISLQEDANELDEVVIVGYSSKTKGEITGSVASVDVGEAFKNPVSNAVEALQGNVSGVTVVSSGQPGGAPSVVIRGVGTTGNTNPLYIIDGVQTTDPWVFNSINTSDIQQMSVLKDGAAAIYGSRAANGVIIITTKSGSYNQGRAKVEVDVYTGLSSLGSTPDVLTPQQHAQMIWDGRLNDDPSTTPSHLQYGTGASPVIPQVLQGQTAGGDPLPNATVNPNGFDWWDVITEAAPTTNATVSMSGGTENFKSYFSASFFSRDAAVKHNSFKRGNVQINTEFKASDKLRIGQHLNVSYGKSRGGSVGAAVESAGRINPLIPVYDDNGVFAGPYNNANELSNAGNPLAALYRSRNDIFRNIRIFGDAYLNYDILEGLTFTSNFSGNLDLYDDRIFTARTPEQAGGSNNNTLSEKNSNSSSWTWLNMLNYTKSFGSHNLSAFAAVEAIENDFKTNTVVASGFFNESPEFYTLTSGSTIGASTEAIASQNSLFSVFGSLDYNYDSRYYLTATVRRDKTSRFAGDNKTSTFPSFSAGWSISNESFFPDDAWVSNLKLKGSWGEMGNQFLPINNPTLSFFRFNVNTADYAFTPGNVSQGALLSQLGNPNLNWEVSVSKNVGLELGMFDNRLTAGIELWQIDTEDLIVQDFTSINSTAPDASAPFVNIGEVRNKGIDFEIAYANETKGGFSYSVSANISRYKNEVISLVNEAPISGQTFSFTGSYTRTEEGEPISFFYGTKVAGFDDDGRWVYEDIDGDGDTNGDSDDRTNIGSPHPDFTYGLNFNGAYKGFDFSLFFNGSQGNDIINHNKIFTDFPTFVNNNRSTRVLDSWTPSNTDATLPALSNTVQGNELNSSTYFVEDGSFLRLKNVQLGYSFNDNVVDKLGLSGLRLYASATNVFTITSYQGLDPEILPINNLNLGIDSRTYPITRLITLGLNLKF
ncbi:SusC/RagA family TonB-linked outer membrane protein [Flagellimonas sp. 2504JD4-2]